MSTTQQHDALHDRLGELAAAMEAQDIDALMDYYDDALVYLENGKERDKAALKDYVQELWSGDSGFSVDLATAHRVDDVLAVTLEASASAEAEAGEKVTISWPMFVAYQFDLTTLKVVREVAFSDEAGVAKKFAAAGIA
ncbi:nuclear transport factor 2 family protein [Marmoricola sp. URHB0036]|uniref:nuclear transport factor 2 family protein n=1 Tax=Marmoricola sp. URHB0036 TaxID=1298863 RepID=UPI00042797AC|nr:nuclear transport factor 2 family protein [Marmoricola sp. URHB0036]